MMRMALVFACALLALPLFAWADEKGDGEKANDGEGSGVAEVPEGGDGMGNYFGLGDEFLMDLGDSPDYSEFFKGDPGGHAHDGHAPLMRDMSYDFSGGFVFSRDNVIGPMWGVPEDALAAYGLYADYHWSRDADGDMVLERGPAPDSIDKDGKKKRKIKLTIEDTLWEF